ELALGRSDGSIVFYELPSGRLLRCWTEYPGAGRALAYSADGSRLAVMAKNGSTVQVISRAASRLLATLPHPAHASSFVWKPPRPLAGGGHHAREDPDPGGR